MLASGESLFLRVTDEPSIDLARTATYVGFAAWQKRFVNRTDTELRHMFDPLQSELTYRHMCQAAAVGRFAGVVAIAHDGDVPSTIGVAWGADDMSGNWLERQTKRHIFHQKPYAWLAQMNVHPAYQRQYIGTSLLDCFLHEFDSHQKPTAYIFDENQPTRQWFIDDLGFSEVPNYPVSKRYFGPHSQPVQQWRLQAESVQDVRARIAVHYKNLPVDPVTR
jgi:ribosomal protein S18 acetylase RimI-like enzyme